MSWQDWLEEFSRIRQSLKSNAAFFMAMMSGVALAGFWDDQPERGYSLMQGLVMAWLLVSIIGVNLRREADENRPNQ
ncbi:hypothetical protein CHH28_16685 [Bacterioplanes sanyensis]|uniref:Uncharacterized protein n=1 Tax=Bacterioplanes sanyensis TaxID=1249553 RepID=A0A222FPA1_9GAMM|nr:hypothetical protein [Bacterioplanes sanyensis]ASP40211.1 hypothetical protein CHH28_16685 [Bacterioplanes sanyensis]